MEIHSNYRAGIEGGQDFGFGLQYQAYTHKLNSHEYIHISI